jgi:hypothetical protein
MFQVYKKYMILNQDLNLNVEIGKHIRREDYLERP